MSASRGFSVVRVLLATFLGLGAIVLAMPYLAARNQKARQEIADAREAASLILGTRRELAQLETFTGIMDPVINNEQIKSIANLLSDNKLSALEEAAGEARDCMSEVGRSFAWYELLMFSLPTDCRSMYNIIDEATSNRTSVRASEPARVAQVNTSPLAPRTPEVPEVPEAPEAPEADGNCRQWTILRINFTAPPTKPGGQDWDFIDSAPDLTLTVSVDGRTQTINGGKDSHRFSSNLPIRVKTNSVVVLQAKDRDVSEDDPVFFTSFVVPEKIDGHTYHADDFQMSIRCSD